MSDPIYLTDEEMKIITGYKLSSKQIEWLKNNDIPHLVNAIRKPIVFRRDLTQQPTNNHIKESNRPNFEALNEQISQR